MARQSARQAPLRWRVVRALFELLYRNRFLYWLASTIPFAGRWRTWQRLVLARLRGPNVLEVGCGTGTLLADMVAAGYTCAAVDRSPQMVAATRSRLRRRSPSAAARALQASVQALPFADASFDSVVSTFPTDYIFDPAALREVARVLRPGARLVVVLGAALLPANLLLLPFVAIQVLVYARAPARRSTEEAAGAAQRADPLLALLRSAGIDARRETVRTTSWEAYLYIGEKSS
jgi:SAM-dependent methyltransferase